MEMYTQRINLQLDYLQEMQQRLSSTLSSMEQETERLAALLEAQSRMESDSKPSSSETPQLSKLLENESRRLLDEGGSRGLTVDELRSAAVMPHLIRYFKVREQS